MTQPGVTSLLLNVLLQVGTAVSGMVVVMHMLLAVKTATTSAPFPPPRMASIIPWMYRTGTGVSMLQYLLAATGATALKRLSPPGTHIICTDICAPELWPVRKTRLVSMQ